ncbi:ABC transporter ATP-binding protein [Natronoflexus pectinivorans]|uniref:Iron complex transport system ATP-binding protein n=1 Tax=Natronoflexus pectinivorans TaxID=682526 RepID=A0A4R2GKW7_9BACT|nr:ABC transporter ATP-binding protein [Natronoflexus pectinivorans]TCO08039.1 iron complex transport system ATP-binding protein [Natronoflexus pectinivorans]
MVADYLKIDKLCCGYGRSFNLKDVSVSLKQGVFAGIIGPNGSGKTTLFKGISGVLKAKSGKILLQNVDLGKLKLGEKARRVAVVSQFPDAADITVEDYVLLGRLPYRQSFQFFESARDRVIARKYMQLTGVFRHAKKLMSQLSGGEQQLAAIAQALTQEPELLLMDEPTSHLDITHQVQILNLIQRLNRETNLTVLMIIHDLNLAAEYCDFLIMMNNGDVHTMGAPLDVLNYKNIEDVYNTVVVTQNNPLSGKPAIFLVSEKVLKEVQERYKRSE